jgi:signal transduction histidine kinase
LYIDVVIPSSDQLQTDGSEPYLVVKRQPSRLPVENELSVPAIPTVPTAPLPTAPDVGAGPPAPPPPPPVPSAPLPSTDLLLGFVLGPEATRSDERSNRHTTTPVQDPRTNQTIGFVTLSEGPAYGRELVQLAAVVIVLASLLATAVAAVVGWWASRRMTTPLLDLTDVTSRMANGNLAIRANTKRKDEIGALALSFNIMAQRIEETVSTLRRFVADAAHELNTPLTALRTHLELALDDDTAERVNFLRSAESDVDRLEQLANDLLDLSRIEDRSTHSAAPVVNLSQVIRELEELYVSRAEQKNVQLAIHLPRDDVFIRADTGQLRRALINVLDNAFKFTPSGGAIALDLTVDSGDVQVTVQDSGIGIPPDDLPHVFSRFHRARNTAAYPGSGLGLAIVKAIMLRHGGTISVQSDGNGTRFTFCWPQPISQFGAELRVGNS